MLRYEYFDVETNEENFIIQILPHLSQHQTTVAVLFLETFDVIHYFNFFLFYIKILLEKEIISIFDVVLFLE